MARKRSTYDELYFKYKGWVVLILKQFMYKAYDESARVLSSIMEYKLYESRDGICSAGPDKDKIMKMLSAFHVNYVIAEYGEITDMRSFPDNRFSKVLASSWNIPVTVPDYDDDPPVDNPPVVAPPVPKRPTVPEWLMPGLEVTHKIFGKGNVNSVNAGEFIAFSVLFSDEKEKKFVYPDAFEKGFLRTEHFE